MDRGTLRNCPECRQTWPQGAEHDLRSFAWLSNLPRTVSVSNADAIIHDGAGGRNRFLILETKRDDEPRQAGQEWLLRSLARYSMFTVRVLRGTLSRLAVHRVTRDGVSEHTYATTPDQFRTAVVHWLDGNPWVDPEMVLPPTTVTSDSIDLDELLQDIRW